MLDWLVKIPGPEFLMYYSLMGLLGIGVGWWLVRGSDGGYPLPDKNQFEPITFAVLRGRWQAAIDVVVVKLIERDVVGIAEMSGEKTLFIKNKTEDLSSVEQVVYDYLMDPKKGSQFNGAELQVSMENALKPVYHELEKMHLCKTDEEVSQGKQITYFMMFCLNGLAISKVYFAMLYNKPFSFLIILILLMSFAILKIVKPGDRVTRLGRKSISEVDKHFSWLKDDIANYSEKPSYFRDYALGTAIFGAGILASSEIFDGYQAFAQRKSYDGIGDSGVYTGDSGGSSDGGSGCGGSGCGGCGGGD